MMAGHRSTARRTPRAAETRGTHAPEPVPGRRPQKVGLGGDLWRTALCIGLLLLSAPAGAAAGQAQPRREPATYTAEQADAGFAAYAQYCASCHGASLDDGPFAPPLRGAVFRETWLPRSVEALFTLTAATMPEDRPGALDDETYAQLVALILQENGVEASGEALPADPDLLAGLAPGWISQGGGLSPGAALPPWPAPWNPLDVMEPVTDAMLHDPPADDWLLWRRTYGAYGFSPLDEIDAGNVADLRVAWSWALPSGPNESTPIVHDGVLFVHGYGDRVQALDAATGDFLWQYSRRLPRDVSPSLKRGLSIYGDRLFVPTSDAHVVALAAKTGDVIWDQPVGDLDAGLRMTGGTLVARGKVMVGTTGRHEGGNYVVALDVETGEEAWRFGTIPGPDDPGGHTWNGIPHGERNGASVWVPGSYDPVNNLALFGTGNTYDTAPLRDPVGPAGTNNDGLYLDTTLALNPDTGELAWHFQHQANGQWDLDWAFERQIAELPVDGEPASVVVTIGKQAIFDFVETKTGRYVSSLDLGLQTGITAIDPGDGPEDPGPVADSGRRRDQAALPARRRRPELGADRLRPAYPRRLRADHRGLHGPRARGRGGTRQPEHRGALDGAPASRERRAVRPAGGGQPGDGRDRLDRPAARSADHRRARHRRGGGVRRLARPAHQRLRRGYRRPALGDAAQRGAQRPADHVCRRRAAVRRGDRRKWRISHTCVLRAGARDPQPAGPGSRPVGLLAAGGGHGGGGVALEGHPGRRARRGQGRRSGRRSCAGYFGAVSACLGAISGYFAKITVDFTKGSGCEPLLQCASGPFSSPFPPRRQRPRRPLPRRTPGGRLDRPGAC